MASVVAVGSVAAMASVAQREIILNLEIDPKKSFNRVGVSCFPDGRTVGDERDCYPDQEGRPVGV